MTRLAAALALVGLVFALAGTALAVAHRRELTDQCSWGASSIVVENGRVVAGPTTTGCVP